MTRKTNLWENKNKRILKNQTLYSSRALIKFTTISKLNSITYCLKCIKHCYQVSKHYLPFLMVHPMCSMVWMFYMDIYMAPEQKSNNLHIVFSMLCVPLTHNHFIKSVSSLLNFQGEYTISGSRKAIFNSVAGYVDFLLLCDIIISHFEILRFIF